MIPNIQLENARLAAREAITSHIIADLIPWILKCTEIISNVRVLPQDQGDTVKWYTVSPMTWPRHSRSEFTYTQCPSFTGIHTTLAKEALVSIFAEFIITSPLSVDYSRVFCAQTRAGAWKLELALTRRSCAPWSPTTIASLTRTTSYASKRLFHSNHFIYLQRLLHSKVSTFPLILYHYPLTSISLC